MVATLCISWLCLTQTACITPSTNPEPIKSAQQKSGSEMQRKKTQQNRKKTNSQKKESNGHEDNDAKVIISESPDRGVPVDKEATGEITKLSRTSDSQLSEKVNIDKTAPFTLTLDEDSSRRIKVNNYFNLTIRPAGRGMELGNFTFTSNVSPNSGELKRQSKKGNNFKKLRAEPLDKWYFISSDKLGSQDTTFKNGEAVTLRLQYVADRKSTASGTKYKLTVTIEQKVEPYYTDTITKEFEQK